MKHIFLLILCAFCFSVSACGNNTDSLATENAEKIQKLESDYKDIQKQIKKLNEENADSLNKTAIVLGVVGCVFGLIASVIAIFVFLKINEKNDDGENIFQAVSHLFQSNDHRKSEIECLKNRCANNQNSTFAPNNYNDNNDLELRLSAVEKNLATFATIVQNLSAITVNQPVQQASSSKNDSQNKKQERMAYLGAPTGAGDKMYFIDELPSCDDKARFKIFKKSDKEAEFDLIDIQRIKSMDSFDSVAKTRGCNLSEAKGFRTTQKGKLVKEDGCWAVKRSLEIELKK